MSSVTWSWVKKQPRKILNKKWQNSNYCLMQTRMWFVVKKGGMSYEGKVKFKMMTQRSGKKLFVVLLM